MECKYFFICFFINNNNCITDTISIINYNYIIEKKYRLILSFITNVISKEISSFDIIPILIYFNCY